MSVIDGTVQSKGDEVESMVFMKEPFVDGAECLVAVSNDVSVKGRLREHVEY